MIFCENHHISTYGLGSLEVHSRMNDQWQTDVRFLVFRSSFGFIAAVTIPYTLAFLLASFCLNFIVGQANIELSSRSDSQRIETGKFSQSVPYIGQSITINSEKNYFDGFACPEIGSCRYFLSARQNPYRIGLAHLNTYSEHVCPLHTFLCDQV